MKVRLQAKPEELRRKFAKLQSRTAVADILEISDNFLCKILYGIKERKRYRTFEIQKKSLKMRQISAPPKNIAILQSKLNSILKLVYEPKYCVHGFAKDRTILSNAERHCNKRHLVNIDLKDFFPSIHIGRIKRSLMSHPFRLGKDAAIVIAQICCKDDGDLPQGGATSPIISNLICRSLDNHLMKFAQNNRCQYTRYADDITFSTSSFHLPKGLAAIVSGELVLSEGLKTIIKKHNFEINPEKTRYTCPFLRQDVTGLTVNEFPNIRRSYVRSIFGALYAWEKYGYKAANKKYLNKYQPRQHSGIHLENVIKGRIAFVKMILGENSPLFRKLATKFNLLSKHKFILKSLEELAPYPLRGKQPKSQVWNKWFNKYKESVLFLEITKKSGDKCQATIFYIGNNLFATAGHNLKQDFRDIQMYFEESQSRPDKIKDCNNKSVDVGIIKKEDERNSTLTWLPTQLRLPEIGEEVAAIGYPLLSQREPTLVMHVGIIEALPVTFGKGKRFIQVSFQSGGGLSGGCLIDKRGFVVGIMTENIYNMGQGNVPGRPYGQAVLVEYLADMVEDFKEE